MEAIEYLIFAITLLVLFCLNLLSEAALKKQAKRLEDTAGGLSLIIDDLRRENAELKSAADSARDWQELAERRLILIEEPKQQNAKGQGQAS